MSQNSLSSCPFCGNENKRLGIRRMGNKGYRVVCGNCGACGPYVAVKDWHDNRMIAQGQAIKGWNARKPMEKIVEQLQRHANQYNKQSSDHTREGFFTEGRRYASKASSYERAIEIVKAGGIDE